MEKLEEELDILTRCLDNGDPQAVQCLQNLFASGLNETILPQLESLQQTVDSFDF